MSFSEWDNSFSIHGEKVSDFPCDERTLSLDPQFQMIASKKEHFASNFCLSVESDSGVSLLGPELVSGSSLGSSVSSRTYDISTATPQEPDDWCAVGLDDMMATIVEEVGADACNFNSTADSAKTIQGGVDDSSCNDILEGHDDFLYDQSFCVSDQEFMDACCRDNNHLGLFSLNSGDNLNTDCNSNGMSNWEIMSGQPASMPFSEIKSEDVTVPQLQTPDPLSNLVKIEEMHTSMNTGYIMQSQPSNPQQPQSQPEEVFPTPISPLSREVAPPSYTSAEAIMNYSRMINEKRNFTNFDDHKWLPDAGNCDYNFPPSYKPVWMQPQLAQDPSLFYAVLNAEPGGQFQKKEQWTNQSASSNVMFDQGGCNFSKKKKNTLKDWDPKEVHYPLGYIPFQNWCHMSDLHPDRQYKFSMEDFIRPPKPDGNGGGRIVIEHQPSKDNKYDALYTRESVTMSRECYCGICDSWHKRDQCNWLHHMKSAHGIRSCTKQRYPLPHIMAPLSSSKTAIVIYLGFCDKCQSWKNVNSIGAVNQYASWFLHQANHDIERNRVEGRRGKKRSKKETFDLQIAMKEEEKVARDMTKMAIRRIMHEDILLNGNCNQFVGSFFRNRKNYEITSEWQDVDGGP